MEKLDDYNNACGNRSFHWFRLHKLSKSLSRNNVSINHLYRSKQPGRRLVLLLVWIQGEKEMSKLEVRKMYADLLYKVALKDYNHIVSLLPNLLTCEDSFVGVWAVRVLREKHSDLIGYASIF